MPIALVTATAAEMRPVLEAFGAGAEPPTRGCVRAKLPWGEAFLVVTGIGPVNAALELGLVLGSQTLSGVVNLGVAGSYDLDAAPLCAVVTASSETYADYGVTGEDGVPSANDFAFPQWDALGKRIMDRIELDPGAASEKMGLCLPGAILFAGAATSAAITASTNRASVLAARHQVLTESMEGFALALACLTRRVPFLEVRTVSNRVGERDRSKWKLKEALAGLKQAAAGIFPD